MAATKRARAVEADVIGKLPDDLTLRAARNVHPPLFRQAPDTLSRIRYLHKDIIIDMLLNKLDKKSLEYFGLRSMGIMLPSKAAAVVPKGFVRTVIKAARDERTLNGFTSRVADMVFNIAGESTSAYRDAPKSMTRAYDDATREVFKVLLATGTLQIEEENDDLVALFKYADGRRSTDVKRSLSSALPRNMTHLVANKEGFSLSRPVLEQLMHVYRVSTKRELYQRVH